MYYGPNSHASTSIPNDSYSLPTGPQPQLPFKFCGLGQVAHSHTCFALANR